MLKHLAVLFLVLTVALTGCQPPALYHQTEGNVADVTLRTREARLQSDAAARPVPTLVVNQGLYVDKTPVSLERQPSWLRNRIVIRGDQLPFSYYSRTIATVRGRNVLTHYQVGLDESPKVSINYSGDVKGAMDLLAAKTGYVYSVNGNDIYWQSFITRTFDVAFMPGSSDYMMGKAAGAGGSTGMSGGGTGAGSMITAITDDSAAAQYSNLKGKLSVWDDLKTTIRELLSPDGKVMVSEATTTVTVRDKPTNVDLVAKFIDNLNNNLSKQVLVKVQILSITLNSDYNFGINWNIVQQAFGGSNYQLVANQATPFTITPLSPGGITQAGLATQAGRTTGFTTLINALKEQGKVSIVTEPRVVCLNNQVSAIRLVNVEGYLASVQNVSNVGSASGTGSSSNFITSQLTPGSLTTGLTLYVLPKIMGDKVYLQVNADLSNKVSITAVSSATGGEPPKTGNQPGSTIQIPSTTQKQFNQRAVIVSGGTLILSGFRQVANQSGATQLMDQQSLGSQAAVQSNAETIVLITPIILHGTG